MIIQVTRSGGFAGLLDVFGPIETSRLDASVANELQTHLISCRFFHLPAQIEATDVGADYLHYEISVEDGPKHHTVSFQDDMSEKTRGLMELISRVEKLSA